MRFPIMFALPAVVLLSVGAGAASRMDYPDADTVVLEDRTRVEYFADGTYTVYLKILAPTQPMLELKFVIPNKKAAQRIYKNWESKASDLYSAIYETLVD